jgi:hypothetical protein
LPRHNVDSGRAGKEATVLAVGVGGLHRLGGVYLLPLESSASTRTV